MISFAYALSLRLFSPRHDFQIPLPPFFDVAAPHTLITLSLLSPPPFIIDVSLLFSPLTTVMNNGTVTCHAVAASFVILFRRHTNECTATVATRADAIIFRFCRHYLRAAFRCSLFSIIFFFFFFFAIFSPSLFSFFNHNNSIAIEIR